MNEKTLSAIVVDDEPLARQILREYIGKERSIEIVAECGNGFEAVKAVNEAKPDLLFLDIQMPKLSGFEVLELLDHKPIVIFVTAYDEYALRAFEVHAVDYLLKPFSDERFHDVVGHVHEMIRRHEKQPIDRVSADLKASPLKRILVRDGSRIHVIPTDKIEYIESSDDYVSIARGDETWKKQETIGNLEKQLDPGRFVRIHRSYLLNVDCLERVELYAKDSRIAILKGGRRIPVSRAGYQKLRERL